MDTSSRSLVNHILKGYDPIPVSELDANERLKIVMKCHREVEPHFTHTSSWFYPIEQFLSYREQMPMGYMSSAEGLEVEVLSQDLVPSTRITFIAELYRKCRGVVLRGGVGFPLTRKDDLYVTQKGKFVRCHVFFSTQASGISTSHAYHTIRRCRLELLSINDLKGFLLKKDSLCLEILQRYGNMLRHGIEQREELIVDMKEHLKLVTTILSRVR